PASDTAPAGADIPPPVSPLTRSCCALAQAACIALFYFLTAAPVALILLLWMKVWAGEVPMTQALLIVGTLVLLAYPAWLLLAILVKWVVMGRYKAGCWPLWGLYYFRWWVASQIQAASHAEMLRGTPLMSLYLRLMGARVGRNCTIDSQFFGAFDLVSIGDDTSIAVDTQLFGARVEGGVFYVGRVDIGSRCFVGTHALVGLDTVMEDDSRLDDLSSLVDGETIPQGQSFKGSPARPGVVQTPEPRR
ncbi:unnamed protein product, partial [marine sediment metagenome]